MRDRETLINRAIKRTRRCEARIAWFWPQRHESSLARHGVRVNIRILRSARRRLVRYAAMA